MFKLKTYVLNVERTVIDESPSSLSSLAAMQMDDDLPVHLNVYEGHLESS